MMIRYFGMFACLLALGMIAPGCGGVGEIKPSADESGEIDQETLDRIEQQKARMMGMMHMPEGQAPHGLSAEEVLEAEKKAAEERKAGQK